MRLSFFVIGMMLLLTVNAEQWSTNRFESFLRNSGRFFESDFDNDDESDVPNRNRDALPLFRDVMDENGWTTNDLVNSLIRVVSNGLESANWVSIDTKRSVSVAVRQLADINHPAVTNFFSSIISNDLHGLEKVVIPGLFKYTFLEQSVMDELYDLCIMTNRYDKAAAIVALDLLDCLDSMPELKKDAAKMRVAKFMYFSMRQVSSSQTWQDEQLAKLIPSYSNSVERLEQMRYLMQHSTRAYEREKATAQFNRLNALPTNALSQVQWIRELVAYPEANLPE